MPFLPFLFGFCAFTLWWGSLTLFTALCLDELCILSSAQGSKNRLACRTFYFYRHGYRSGPKSKNRYKILEPDFYSYRKLQTTARVWEF
nr:hypothetical protein [uncultured Campylobacter sp.]